MPSIPEIPFVPDQFCTVRFEEPGPHEPPVEAARMTPSTLQSLYGVLHREDLVRPISQPVSSKTHPSAHQSDLFTPAPAAPSSIMGIPVVIDPTLPAGASYMQSGAMRVSATGSVPCGPPPVRFPKPRVDSDTVIMPPSFCANVEPTIAENMLRESKAIGAVTMPPNSEIRFFPGTAPAHTPSSQNKEAKPPSPYSIVLDCETLGRTPRAAILEIGAVAFVRADFTIFEEFEIQPSIAEQIMKGRMVEKETIDWHLKQGSLNPYAFHGPSMMDSAADLRAWIMRIQPHTVWIQGTCFDRPLVEDFFDMLGLKLPWDFWQSRDARTYFATAFGDEKHPPRPHRAKADARDTLASIAKAWVHLRDNPAALV